MKNKNSQKYLKHTQIHSGFNADSEYDISFGSSSHFLIKDWLETSQKRMQLYTLALMFLGMCQMISCISLWKIYSFVAFENDYRLVKTLMR